jgi:hypothetical protein
VPEQDEKKPAVGFVALKSLVTGAPPDPSTALDEIRRIYFNTTNKTIDDDVAHAIELLKSLPTEEAREKATVFMHGLSEMQREWRAKKAKTARMPKHERRRRTRNQEP